MEGPGRGEFARCFFLFCLCFHACPHADTCTSCDAKAHEEHALLHVLPRTAAARRGCARHGHACMRPSRAAEPLGRAFGPPAARAEPSGRPRVGPPCKSKSLRADGRAQGSSASRVDIARARTCATFAHAFRIFSPHARGARCVASAPFSPPAPALGGRSRPRDLLGRGHGGVGVHRGRPGPGSAAPGDGP